MVKKRLDDLLVERGLAADRKEAAALVMKGVVLVQEQRQSSPAVAVDSSASIRVKKPRLRYVSRGGLKLEYALRELKVQVQGCVCLDLGASTGGFTDCLLQHGARRVYAFDVGRGQLAWKLQQDPRVVRRDSVNVRYLEPAMVGEPVDLVTVDLSFISLRQILPALHAFAGVRILALVKPQFEALPQEVGKGGVIRSERQRDEIVSRVEEFASRRGFHLLGRCPSPVPGQKGNREVFLYLQVEADGRLPEADEHRRA